MVHPGPKKLWGSWICLDSYQNLVLCQCKLNKNEREKKEEKMCMIFNKKKE